MIMVVVVTIECLQPISFLTILLLLLLLFGLVQKHFPSSSSSVTSKTLSPVTTAKS